MSTPAQIAANIANAQASTGPRTAEGRATSSENATTHGLFAARDFIRPGEEDLYQQNKDNLHEDLAPAGILECNLTDEIHRAIWRLRRCGEVEAGFVLTCTVDPMQDESAAKLQNSVDRARAQSHRLLHKCTAELRKLQTERHFRNEYFPAGADLTDLGLCDLRSVRKGVDEEVSATLRRHKLDDIIDLAGLFRAQGPPDAAPKNVGTHPSSRDSAAMTCAGSSNDTRQRTARIPLTKPTQSAPVQTPRNAQCPCNSGQKYKRCCGRNAPAVRQAA